MVELTSHGVTSVETLVVNVANPATAGCRPYQRVEIKVNNVDGSVLTLNLYTQENTNMAFSHTERTQ